MRDEYVSLARKVQSWARITTDKLDVAGHATMASATVQGQLYVGNKEIGGLMENMSAELERSKSEMATMRATLEELTKSSMLKQK